MLLNGYWFIIIDVMVNGVCRIVRFKFVIVNEKGNIFEGILRWWGCSMVKYMVMLVRKVIMKRILRKNVLVIFFGCE